MTLIASVSGVRGIVGRTLTDDVVREFARAYGRLLRGGRVVLARDTRPSGAAFAAAAEQGLRAEGCAVTHVGVAMTPSAAWAIGEGRFDGGVVVTASHNPAEWNGLKFLDERGLAPDPQRAAQIVALRDRGVPAVEAPPGPVSHDEAAGRRHVDAVRAAMEVDVSPLRGLRVVLDSVNGAGCRDTPRLLQALGCELVHLNAEPTGQFAHGPEPLAENLSALCEAVRRHGAAIGFAQDPDADRMAIVDEAGRYIGEEYTLALAARFVLSRRPGPVAANLSTSRMIDDVARRYGAPVHRTPVGEAHVARAILEHGCVIGGEGNGGVIDPRISLVRDSISAISLVLQLLAGTCRAVSALLEDIPRYVIVKQKAECQPERLPAALDTLASAFAERRPDRRDGVRIDLDEGWVHVRGSNTEPIVRLIAEAHDERAARVLIDAARRAAGL
jgi:phosphomannomutase